MRWSVGVVVVSFAPFCATLGCPKPNGDAPPSAKTSATGSSSSPLVIPPPSSSQATSAQASASSAALDRLPETIAAIVAAPKEHAPKHVEPAFGETHFTFDVPGVRQALLIVVENRPDAWSFNLYVEGAPPETFGSLKPLRAPKEGGRRWLVMDGPLKGCELFRSPNDPSFYVLVSPTWVDAHE